MRKYVRECLQKHPPDRFPVGFVQCVFDGAQDEARDKELVSKATKALVELSREKGPEVFIPLEQIRQRAGITRTVGLWPWLGKEAGVVEQEQPEVRAYRIKNKFYDAMLALVPTPSPVANRPGLLSLQGLGKEVWAGIDAQAYVDRERSAIAQEFTNQ